MRSVLLALVLGAFLRHSPAPGQAPGPGPAQDPAVRSEQAGAGAPNVLLLTMDQLAYDWLGFTSPGLPAIQTPNLDRLAQNGTFFRRYYVDADTCHPSRCSLLTGKPPMCHGALSESFRLPDSEVTLAEKLARAGYATAAFGKIHNRASGAQQGFQQARDMGVYLLHLRSLGYRPGNSLLWQSQEYRTGMNRVPAGLQLQQLITDDALAFLQASVGQPWFLYLSYQYPHPPWVPQHGTVAGMDPADVDAPLPDLAVWANKPLFQRQRFRANGFDHLDAVDSLAHYLAYLGCIEETDRYIGQILQQLEQSGELARTMIVFTPDHGDMAGQLGVFEKGFGTYESIVHVPLIVQYAPLFPPGTAVDELVQGSDIAPTIYEVLGLQAPPGTTGESFLQLAQGGPPIHEVVFSAAEIAPASWMVHDGAYVLIAHPGDMHELYDLTLDPEQEVNRYNELLYAGIRARLTQLLDTWRRSGCN
ncbi:MAG: hypothetical protein EYC70_13040 [Planctomycetota bacterium]|nr:MAG: hypothetical protein EYC70_13040 [Planctomycetota bacterium]